MPSLEESRRRVREGLDKQVHEVDHNDILASLQDEIDKHNAVKDDLRQSMRSSRRRCDDKDENDSSRSSKRLRFKHRPSSPSKRKHRSTSSDHSGSKHKHRRKRHHHHSSDRPAPEASHPFPREPTNPDDSPPTDAFRTSLFDALADDEGAAYWESVYSQPIHIYARPATQQGPQGELEAMGDEEYVEYVKRRMWERKHPEVMLEREQKARNRKKAEEERTRDREEFIRRKERAAWERAERRGARKAFGGESDGEEDRYERDIPRKEFATDHRSKTAKEKEEEAEYTAAWSRYLSAWEELKNSLSASTAAASSQAPSKILPWPLLHPTLPVTRPNISAFIHHAPAEDSGMRLKVLKAERVRWHPDKIQQRFGGNVDEGTMRLVTGVFQVVDGVFEEARKGRGGS